MAEPVDLLAFRALREAGDRAPCELAMRGMTGVWDAEATCPLWVRWDVDLDPVTGLVQTRLCCQQRGELVHEVRFRPEESEVERHQREGIMAYVHMFHSFMFGAGEGSRRVMGALLGLLLLV